MAADLLSKWAVGRLNLQPGEELLKEFPIFGIVWTMNKGGIFGLGQGFTPFFVLASLGAIGVILWLLYSAPKDRVGLQITLGMVLAGALGNLYDRIFLGGVRDFINFHFITWPAFNVADVCISVGCCLLVLMMLFERRRTEAANDA